MGMPGEWFFLLVELLAGALLGLTPATLNRLVLQYSVESKFGHTQKPEDTCGNNFHADHHLLHVKNFGNYNCLMDMFFTTANHNQSYLIRPEGGNLVYRVEKKIEEKTQFSISFSNPLEPVKEVLYIDFTQISNVLGIKLHTNAMHLWSTLYIVYNIIAITIQNIELKTFIGSTNFFSASKAAFLMRSSLLPWELNWRLNITSLTISKLSFRPSTNLTGANLSS